MSVAPTTYIAGSSDPQYWPEDLNAVTKCGSVVLIRDPLKMVAGKPYFETSLTGQIFKSAMRFIFLARVRKEEFFPQGMLQKKWILFCRVSPVPLINFVVQFHKNIQQRQPPVKKKQDGEKKSEGFSKVKYKMNGLY